jgi:DNA polymerase III epsilon subunit-like protein
MKIIVFDTETTGMLNPSGNIEDQPFVIQFAAITYEYNPRTSEMHELSRYDQLIKPPIAIPAQSSQIHNISDEMVQEAPVFEAVADEIQELFKNSDLAVAHNLEFDQTVLDAEFVRAGLGRDYLPKQLYDTMKETKPLCKLLKSNGNYKSPRLMELYQFLFGEVFSDAHNAINDVEATGRCLEKLLKEGYFVPVVDGAPRIVQTEQISLF